VPRCPQAERLCYIRTSSRATAKRSEELATRVGRAHCEPCRPFRRRTGARLAQACQVEHRINRLFDSRPQVRDYTGFGTVQLLAEMSGTARPTTRAPSPLLNAVA
jgi:hypothetical protein